MTRVVYFGWLVILWVALWGDVSWANVLGGAAVAAGVMAVSRSAGSGRLVLRPLRILHFAGYFAFKLVESTVIVAREVLTRHSRIHRGIVAVRLSGCSDALVTIIANAITLTPGTLTLEVREDPQTLYVHVLHLEDVEAVRADIRTLERLAIRAFGTRDALAAFEAEGRMTTPDEGGGGR